MKNYIGFYVILTLLIIALIFSAVKFYNAEKNLLEKAYAMKSSSDNVHSLYEEFKSEFKKNEYSFMMLVNHNQYKDIYKCLIRLGKNIEYQDERNIAIDIDEIIFLLEELTEGEKCTLNNIF